ncbi:hypothetical protein MJ904_25125 [Massilia sp. MB5]|uniref:hypothetical protein n=1 Tax=Massilia sp. MB5 TaxID=2919578 RepID=UPI001F0DCD43|nr:hypothetical protein [Massilia sp. MB5]UMR30235.1 hypothetical protein MJ904_25125 [Massilia sp. MB5]
MEASRQFMAEVIGKFKPARMSGHLAIGHDSISIPLEPNEFTYSSHLDAAPVFVFFEQRTADKDRVLVLHDGRSLAKIFENAFGMEYFVSDEKHSYLLAVNWYVIEGTGECRTWMKRLAGLDSVQSGGQHSLSICKPAN